MADGKENRPSISTNTFKVSGLLHRCNATLGRELINNDKGEQSQLEHLKEFITDKFNDLENRIKIQNEEQIKLQAENNVMLKKLFKQQIVAENVNIKFPIKNETELLKLEEDIGNNKEEYISNIKKIINPGGIIKNLYKLLESEVIINYNYDGIKNKKAFKDFKQINNVLFDCLLRDGYTEKDYIIDIKKAFKTHKNRYFKNKCINKYKTMQSAT